MIRRYEYFLTCSFVNSSFLGCFFSLIGILWGLKSGAQLWEGESSLSDDLLPSVCVLDRAFTTHAELGEGDRVECLSRHEQALSVGARLPVVSSGKKQQFGKHSVWVQRLKGFLELQFEQEGVWVGQLVHLREPVERGDRVVLAWEGIQQTLAPVPAPEVQKTVLLPLSDPVLPLLGFEPEFLIPLGKEDGVQSGMIVRQFDQQDLKDRTSFHVTHQVIRVDYQVRQVASHFSLVKPLAEHLSAWVDFFLGSEEQTPPVYLLQDVQEVGQGRFFQKKAWTEPEADKLFQHWLDHLPDPQLSLDEAHELIQLEHHLQSIFQEPGALSQGLSEEGSAMFGSQGELASVAKDG